MALDYSGQNLRGRSFRGQNLEGANFSGADIRSANFSGASLIGANFSHARLGLQRRWAIFLVFVSWVVMCLSGFLSAFAGAFVAYLVFNTEKDYQLAYQIAGWTNIAILVIFLFLTVRQGILGGLGAIVIAAAATFAAAGAIAAIGTRAFATAIAFAVAITVVVAIAGATTGSVAVAITVVAAIAVAIAVAFAFAFAFVGAIAGAIAATAATVLCSTYISWRVLKGDLKHALIRNIAIAFAAFKGTSFHSADLSSADFTQTTLKSTDFRKANLTRTCWQNAQKLDRVRPGSTYLQKAHVRRLLVTGQGQNKNFDRQDLRGVNLQGANLVNASFIGSDLSEANLRNADLSRAKLVQTQLDKTDLTASTLTGATIEDWGITSHTKLYGVRCEYVFMRSPTPDDPNPRRKPDNWNETFADGDFADFIKPIVDTLDLYHNSGVDPRAIAISFKQLAENHPEAELRIVGMEVKGEDKFLLRAKTAPTADKSELSAEYFLIYNELKALAQQEVKALISEKDYQIHRLENMVMTALERPGFYAQTYNNQGDTMPGKQSKFNLQGAQFAGGLVDAETVTAHQIGGNITNHAQVSPPETNSSTVKTILILASNPRNTSALRLDEEVREIDTGLQRAKCSELQTSEYETANKPILKPH